MKKIDDITMRRKAYAIRKALHIPLKDALEQSKYFAHEINWMIGNGYSDEEIRLILMIYRFPVDYLAV